MDTTQYTDLVNTLRHAESATWALVGSHGERAAEAHQLTAKALRAAETLSAAPACARPDCTNTVPYGGRGRPPRFCSRGCREWTARRAKRHRQRKE